MNFIDPLINRKKKLTDVVQFYKKIPLPSVIEISESGTCNRKCSFCPRSSPDFRDIKEFISINLLKKLVKELGRLNYSGIFLFSGFVEPLLDKNIFSLIEITRKYLPKAKIEMVTNGDVLNATRIKKLYQAGLSTLLISIYDSKKDADKMEKLFIDNGINNEKFKIRHRYLKENESFGITLSNRAGMMDNAEYKIPSLLVPLKKPCYYPHYTFFMDYTGEVLICSHDWGKKLIAGNINFQTFIEIWTGKAFNDARERLKKGDRNFSPCDKCDVNGILMGQKHKDSWKNKISL